MGFMRNISTEKPQPVTAGFRHHGHSGFVIQIDNRHFPSFFQQCGNDTPADPLRTANVPSAAVWHALEFAASQKRIGETVMLSMTAMGGGGPARSAAITLHHVVKALLAVGLETEARMLSLEAALASGA